MIDVNDLPPFSPRSLPGDSVYYQILYWAAKEIRDVPGLTCEIGLRQGGGTESIVQGSIDGNDPRIHVAIDPYGDIEYKMQGRVCRMAYTNQMKIDALAAIYSWFKEIKQQLVFFNMEDAEFFKRFEDGVPVYAQVKNVVNSYALVHIDGSHDLDSVSRAVNFFASRTPAGGIWIFDDVDMYSHGKLSATLQKLKMRLVIDTGRKMAYRRDAL